MIFNIDDNGKHLMLISVNICLLLAKLSRNESCACVRHTVMMTLMWLSTYCRSVSGHGDHSTVLKTKF